MFKFKSWCFLAFVAALFGTSVNGDELRRGDVVFEMDFGDAASRARWSELPCASWVPEGPGNSMVLRCDVPESAARDGNMIAMPFDLTPYRGMKLTLECMAKAENVTKPSQSWLGVKFMLHYKSPSLGPHWSNQGGVQGTFDWKKLRFTPFITEDADGGQLNLGLQGCWGRVWFDKIRVTVACAKPPVRPAPMLNPPPVYKGHDLPRLRGVMSPHAFKDANMRVLGEEWKANLIRWQITRRWGQANTDRDLEEYDTWLDTKLEDLDKGLEACGRYGIKVVMDLHSPPGGRYENKDMAMFFETKYQDHFVKVWERIARRYKGNKAVWAYDLVNEPVQGEPSPEGVADYVGTQVRAAKAIRAIDADVPIIFEVDQWDSANGFRYMMPVDVSNVIYQVHMYHPGQFTHQGVHGSKVGISYPGKISGGHCDKEALRTHLKPVRDFQLAYNVHIYCGEFSAIRWAPGDSGYNYLKDCIELFEEYGWDWTYHAFREWDGWSLEHGPDPKNHEPTVEPTKRLQLFLEWYGKNVKPPVVDAAAKEQKKRGLFRLFRALRRTRR